MIKQELDRIKERISNKDFLENKGLSNEVGIHVFCYKAEDELIVQDYIRRLKSEVNTPYRIIECDLYEVFLSLLEDKRILKSVAGLEEKRGKKYLLDQLQKIATPEALLAKMDYSPHIKGQDVLFMTGIGKIHPFMRSHKMLDSMQHIFEDIPIVMFYPEPSMDRRSIYSTSSKKAIIIGHSICCNGGSNVKIQNMFQNCFVGIRGHSFRKKNFVIFDTADDDVCVSDIDR